MESGEGRSPRPRGGDPNVKTMALSLTTEEWRKLRAWAAHEGISVEVVVCGILRRELRRRPRRTYGQEA